MPNLHPLKQRNDFELKAKNLLFKGVLWYKLANRLTWEGIGLKLKENGHKYNHVKFRALDHNWAANNIVYYWNIYDTFKIPTPTPELLIFWDTEIARLRSERAEELRVKREKREARKRK